VFFMVFGGGRGWEGVFWGAYGSADAAIVIS